MFLYNELVTNVEIYVGNTPNKEIVAGVTQTFLTEWTRGGCLEYTRAYLPPYSVHNIPEGETGDTQLIPRDVFLGISFLTPVESIFLTS